MESACLEDIQKFCAGEDSEDGVLACLKSHRGELSPACLSEARGRWGETATRAQAAPSAVAPSKPKRRRKRTPPPSPPAPRSMIAKNGDRWTNLFWGFELTLPGFVETPLPPGSAPQPAQALLATDARLHPDSHVNVAVEVEELDKPETASDCAQRRLLGTIYQRQPRGMTGDDGAVPTRVFDENATPAQMEAMGLFHGAQAIPLIRQGYAYFTRGSVCYELHLTHARLPWQTLKPDVPRKMAEIIRSFKLTSEPIGDLDTISLAAEQGASSVDPAFYARLGDVAYERLSDPAKAVRYYRAALALGIDGPRTAFRVRERLARCYAKLGKNADALPLLDEAVKLADQAGVSPKRRRAAAFERAIAEARAGDLEVARDRFSGVLKELAPGSKERRGFVSRIETDPALAALRADPGSAGWLKSLRQVPDAKARKS